MADAFCRCKQKFTDLQHFLHHKAVQCSANGKISKNQMMLQPALMEMPSAVTSLNEHSPAYHSSMTIISSSGILLIHILLKNIIF